MSQNDILVKIAESGLAGIDKDLPYFHKEVVPHIKRRSIGSWESLAQPWRYLSESIDKIPLMRMPNHGGGYADALASRDKDGAYSIYMKDNIPRRAEQAAHEYRHAIHDSAGLGGNRTAGEEAKLDKAYKLSPETVRMLYGTGLTGENIDRIKSEEQAAINAEYQWRAFADQRKAIGRRPEPHEFVDHIKNAPADYLRHLRTSFGQDTSIYEKLNNSMPELRDIMRRHGISSTDDISKVLFRNSSEGVDPGQASKIEAAKEEIFSLFNRSNSKPWNDTDISDEDVESFRSALQTAKKSKPVGWRSMSEKIGQSFSPDRKTFTLSKGQTPTHAARALGVPVQSVLDANPGIDPKAYRIGVRYNAPTAQATEPQSDNIADSINAAVKDAIPFTMQWERYVPNAYWDDIGKKWTVGHGHTRIKDSVTGKMRDVQEHDTMDENASKALLEKIMRQNAVSLYKNVPWFRRIDQGAMSAVLDKSFNAGWRVFLPAASKNLANKMSVPGVDPNEAYWSEHGTYASAGGKTDVPGLVNRQNASEKLWKSLAPKQ